MPKRAKSDGAPFDPRRLKDRQRPTDVGASVVNSKVASSGSGATEIRVVGIGGAGNNAINRMVEAGVLGVEFVAVNSDAQDLASCLAGHKIAIGAKTTRNLGAGGNPSVGERAAFESSSEIEAIVTGADMVFVTAGMGGGPGTGGAPTIARIAKAAGALTVGVVTMPFMFEGSIRRRSAEEGLEDLRDHVDALVVIQNDRLVDVVQKNTSMADAFKAADTMLLNGVRGITDLITSVGFVNVDFADVRSIVENSGTAIMGVGVAGGEDRAEAALRQAAESPLIDIPLEGASGILVNIAGGQDLGIHEIQTVVSELKQLASPDARIVFGAVVDPEPMQTLSVTLIATGFGGISTREPWARRTFDTDVPAAPVRQVDMVERVVDESSMDLTDTAEDIPAPGEPEVREVASSTEDGSENSEVPAFIRRNRPDK